MGGTRFEYVDYEEKEDSKSEFKMKDDSSVYKIAISDFLSKFKLMLSERLFADSLRRDRHTLLLVQKKELTEDNMRHNAQYNTGIDKLMRKLVFDVKPAHMHDELHVHDENEQYMNTIFLEQKIADFYTAMRKIGDDQTCINRLYQQQLTRLDEKDAQLYLDQHYLHTEEDISIYNMCKSLQELTQTEHLDDTSSDDEQIDAISVTDDTGVNSDSDTDSISDSDIEGDNES
jgi:hypothetical protein